MLNDKSEVGIYNIRHTISSFLNIKNCLTPFFIKSVSSFIVILLVVLLRDEYFSFFHVMQKSSLVLICFVLVARICGNLLHNRDLLSRPARHRISSMPAMPTAVHSVHAPRYRKPLAVGSREENCTSKQCEKGPIDK